MSWSVSQGLGARYDLAGYVGIDNFCGSISITGYLIIKKKAELKLATFPTWIGQNIE